jgi:hypothetical protein
MSEGYNAPASVHWIAHDPVYDRCYVISELYESGLLPEAMASRVMDRDRAILRKDPGGEVYENGQVGDSSDPERPKERSEPRGC